MSKEVLSAKSFCNAEELQKALGYMLGDAAALGHHPTTVYVNKGRITLVEETLSDDSKVLNICLIDETSAEPAQ
jgi:hypothetical protein